MKKKLIALGVMGVLLLALVAGLLALREEELPAAEEGPGELKYVYQYGTPPRSIRLEGGGREPYTLERTELDPEKNLATGSAMPGWERLPLDTARINGVLNASRNLVYTELVYELAEDYGAFGLDEPRARVRLDFGEEGARSLLVGDAAPGNIGVYVRLEDEPAVYLCPAYALDSYLLSPADYLSRSVTPSTGLPMDFTSMTLGGGCGKRRGKSSLLPPPPPDSRGLTG